MKVLTAEENVLEYFPDAEAVRIDNLVYIQHKQGDETIILGKGYNEIQAWQLTNKLIFKYII